MNRVIALIKKEFLHLFRDPRSLTLTIALPVFLLILFGYAVTLDVKNIKIAVLDQDKTKESRIFLEGFTNSNYFIVTKYLNSMENAPSLMDKGEIKMVLNIPSDFTKDISNKKPAKIQILIDGSDPNLAATAAGYIQTIIENYSKDRLVQALKTSSKSPRPVTMPIKFETRILYNPELKSINFFVPGLICLILMMTSSSLTSLSIVGEKERGSAEGLFASPIRPLEIMFGKLAPYVIIALIDIVLITLTAIFLFHVPFRGSAVFLFFSSFVFLICALGVGLLISSSVKSSQTAMVLALTLTMLPTVMLSGFIFPIENMPWLLQFLSNFIPATYYLRILRGIFLKGIGLNYLWRDFGMLIVFSIVIILAAASRFKKRLDNV